MRRVDLGVEVELVDDVPGRLGKPGDVVTQVAGHVVRIGKQRRERVLRRVVKRLAGGMRQHRGPVLQAFGELASNRQHIVLGGLQHAIQPAQHRQRQNHPAVLGLLVNTPQQISNRPDEGSMIRGCLVAHPAPLPKVGQNYPTRIFKYAEANLNAARRRGGGTCTGGSGRSANPTTSPGQPRPLNRRFLCRYLGLPRVGRRCWPPGG